MFRQSPAMAVAVAALVFSTTGVATGQLPNPLPLQNLAAPPQITVRAAPDFTEGISDARCLPGERAVGGGGARSATGSGTHIDASLPYRFSAGVTPSANPDTWRISGHRDDGADAFVQAWVVCQKP